MTSAIIAILLWCVSVEVRMWITERREKHTRADIERVGRKLSRVAGCTVTNAELIQRLTRILAGVKDHPTAPGESASGDAAAGSLPRSCSPGP